jgi:hypothetical protein
MGKSMMISAQEMVQVDTLPGALERRTPPKKIGETKNVFE